MTPPTPTLSASRRPPRTVGVAVPAPQQLTLFYEQYFDSLVALAHSHTRDWAAAQDVVQDIFTSLVNRWEAIHQPERYLRRAVACNASRYAPGSGRILPAGAAEDVEEAMPSAPPEDFTASLDLEQSVTDEIRALPDMQRTVVASYMADCSITQIAEDLRITTSTVRTHLSVARRRLRERLVERQHSTAGTTADDPPTPAATEPFSSQEGASHVSHRAARRKPTAASSPRTARPALRGSHRQVHGTRPPAAGMPSVPPDSRLLPRAYPSRTPSGGTAAIGPRTPAPVLFDRLRPGTRLHDPPPALCAGGPAAPSHIITPHSRRTALHQVAPPAPAPQPGSPLLHPFPRRPVPATTRAAHRQEQTERIAGTAQFRDAHALPGPFRAHSAAVSWRPRALIPAPGTGYPIIRSPDRT